MIDQAFIKRNTTEAVFKTLLVDKEVYLLDSHDAGKDAILAIHKVQQALRDISSSLQKRQINGNYFVFLNRDEALMEVG